MKKFQTIRKDVIAEQLTDENAEELAEWCNGTIVIEFDTPQYNDLETELTKGRSHKAINYPSLYGNRRVSTGQYLVKDDKGFRTIVASVFNHEYEEDAHDEEVTLMMDGASNVINKVFGPRKI